MVVAEEADEADAPRLALLLDMISSANPSSYRLAVRLS